MTKSFDTGDSQPGVSFVSDVEPDQQCRDRFDRARIGERAAVNITATRNRGDQREDALFGLLVIAANNDVAFYFVGEVGQGVGPGVLEGRDDLNAFRRKISALFRRRSGPHAQHARGFASDGRFEWNSDINEKGTGLDFLAYFLERGNVSGERNC